MNEGHDYRCPRCKGDDISFSRINNVGRADEEILFYCYPCRQYFGITDPKGGYLPNAIALLKERYPCQKDKGGV